MLHKKDRHEGFFCRKRAKGSNFVGRGRDHIFHPTFMGGSEQLGENRAIRKEERGGGPQKFE